MPREQERLAISPHRAYRRLPFVKPWSLGLSLLLLLGLEAVLLIFLADIARLFSQVAFHLVPEMGATVRQGDDRFLGVPLSPLLFSVPPMTYQTVFLWVIGSLGSLLLLLKVPWIAPPFRILLIYNLFLIGATAVYLLFAGHLGYEAEDFSRLYLRTIVIVWLVLPVFMGGLSMTLPFSPLEQLGYVVCALLYNFLFSAVRYALFIWVIWKLGVVMMADLYLFFGPLMDFIYSVGIFTFFLMRLTRRLDRQVERWTWL